MVGEAYASSSMQRYSGEPLGSRPHIVVLGSCKVGNFVVSTPVLKGLRARFPDAVIGFLGSEITADFERAFPGIDWRHSWDDPSPGAALLLHKTLHHLIERHGPIGLAVNLDGFNPVTCCLVPALEPLYVAGGALAENRHHRLPWGELPQQRFLADADWDQPVFLDRYRSLFKSQYIAELFCQLAFVSDHVDPFAIELPAVQPSFPVPDLLIHCTTARPAKLWPASSWVDVILYAESLGWTVGLVGSAPTLQQSAYNAGCLETQLLEQTNLIDLRGHTTLIELAGACQAARAMITVDAGPLHIAAAMATPVLAIVGNDSEGVGASPIRLWMPRCPAASRTVSEHSCAFCGDQHFKNDDCLVPGHPCMAGVSAQQVINWLAQIVISEQLANSALGVSNSIQNMD